MTHVVPPHYLRKNHSERTPTDVVVIDTETTWVDTATTQIHRLRLWVASHDRRNDDRRNPTGTTWANGADSAALVDFLERQARSGVSLWVFAHNLSFDLSICPLPDLLCERGWRLTEFSSRTDHPWFRFSRGNHRITLADSHSWIPTSLAELAKTSMLVKPELPANDDDPRYWLHRCTADVALVRDAILTILDWWETQELGRWAISGPACGWNAWRHRFYAGNLFVDPDPTVRDFERRAMYGGRREAFQVGCSPGSTFADVDFVTAYPAVAGASMLPERRLHSFPGLSDSDPIWDDPKRGFVGHVTVTTDVPCLPCRVDGSVLYPVGTFATIACEPEITYARNLGATVEVGSGVAYQLAPLLRDWAQWVTSSGPTESESWPAPIASLLKHWGRTVIGRFAARSSTSTLMGDSPLRGWHLEHGTDLDTGADLSILDVGGQRWLITHDTEPENALPAVTAYVEALCRIQLDKGMRRTGLDRVVQCDTDGWLTDLGEVGRPWRSEVCRKPGKHRAMPRPPTDSPHIPATIGPMSTHVKAWYRHADILGPSHLWLDGQRRLSGVPHAAQANDDGTFTATLWPKLGYQLSRSEVGLYTRPKIDIVLKGPYCSRWVLTGGRTEPPRARMEGRITLIEPWTPADTLRTGGTPTGPQHPLLERAGNREGS